MRKYLLLSGCLLLLCGHMQAQTFAEWFKQKSTQKKYLIEQIAALKVYAEFAGKSYKIGREGLGIIGRIKDGDFNLHRDFFGSLKYANPEIRKYPRVADILRLQEQIMTRSKGALATVRQSEEHTAGEWTYWKSVYGRLYEDCDHDLELINNIIGNGGELTMTDDERLKHIDAVFSRMEYRWAFCQEFSQKVLFLIGSRNRDLGEAAKVSILNGLK